MLSVVCLAGVTHWLTKPLPPPKVTLSMVGFKVAPTNGYAVMAMTNLGPTKACFRGTEWRAEFETTDGTVTNYPWFRRLPPFPFESEEGRTFSVGVPGEIIRWRVIASYEWLERNNVRINAIEWLDGHLDLDDGPVQRVLENVLGPALGSRPDHFDLYDFVTTPWLTNQPPAKVAE